MKIKYCTKKKNKNLCIVGDKDIDLLSTTKSFKNLYTSYWRGSDKIGSKSFIYLMNQPDVKDNVCYAMTVSSNTDYFKKNGTIFESFCVTFDIYNNRLEFPRLVNNGWLDYDELPEKYPDFKIPDDVKKKNEEFFFYLIKKCKKRFFAIPISILWKTEKGHANIILYDTKNKEMEYFEPYGDIHSKLFFKNKPKTSERLMKMELSFVEYCKKHLGDIKYFPTLSFCPSLSFQSKNDLHGSRQEGEKSGYCMAWSLWYLHMRLKNINMDRKTLIGKALEELDKNKKGYRRFIRNYSQFLLENIGVTTKKKKECPPGKVLNEKTNRCVKKKEIKTKTARPTINEKKIINTLLSEDTKKPIEKKNRWEGTSDDIFNSFFFIVNQVELKDKVCYTFSKNNKEFEDYSLIFNLIDYKAEIEYPGKIPQNLFSKMYNCDKRFFALPLVIFWSKYDGHFNMIIFDTKLKEIEFFEPYGKTPTDINKMIKIKELEKDFVKFLNTFFKFKEKKNEIKYIQTLDFCPDKSFQNKNETYGSIRKEDPGGFCGVWGLWYLNMRLKYPDVDRKKLVETALSEISDKKEGFRRFIRNYSDFLKISTTKKKQCPPGKVINEKTNRCIIKREPKTKKLKIVEPKPVPVPVPVPVEQPKKKQCPPGKILNEKTNRCIIKREPKIKTKKLKIVEPKPVPVPVPVPVEQPKKKQCPPGKILNEKTNRCIIKREPKIKTKKLKIVDPTEQPKKKQCPPGQILNEKTNRCIKELMPLLSTNKKNLFSFTTNWIGTPKQTIKSFLFLVNKTEFKDKVCHNVKSSYKNNNWNTFAVIFDISYKDNKDGILFLPYDDDLKSSLTEIRNVFYKKINNCKKQFYAIPMVIVWEDKSLHFNIIIIDMIKEEVEIFEPYGETPSSAENILKIRRLSDKFVKGLHEYGNVISKNVKLVPTTSFCPEQSFQVRNENYGSIRTDDPRGFCVVWGLWYLNMRLKYPDIEKKDLVDKALREMTNKKKGYRRFIRNYSQFLLKEGYVSD